MLKKICVYLDGTDESVKALSHAIEIARQFQLELFTVYIVNSELVNQLTISRIFAQAEAVDMKNSLHEDALKYSHLAKNMALKANVTIETLVEEGSLLERLTKVINEHAIDLLVIGLKIFVNMRGGSFDLEKKRILEELKADVLIVKTPV